MIASLKGTVSVIQKFIIVEVSGVGYKVTIPETVSESLRVGDEVVLFTHQHVREDMLDLYGFISLAELELFEQLISVSGVGPKAGLALLSQFSAAQLQQSIITGDTSLLTKVSGIGKKTAERLILELKGSLGDVMISAKGSASGEVGIAASALEQLGYSAQEVLEALKDVDSESTVEEQIKHALGVLGS